VGHTIKFHYFIYVNERNEEKKNSPPKKKEMKKNINELDSNS